MSPICGAMRRSEGSDSSDSNSSVREGAPNWIFQLSCGAGVGVPPPDSAFGAGATGSVHIAFRLVSSLLATRSRSRHRTWI